MGLFRLKSLILRTGTKLLVRVCPSPNSMHTDRGQKFRDFHNILYASWSARPHEVCIEKEKRENFRPRDGEKRIGGNALGKTHWGKRIGEKRIGENALTMDKSSAVFITYCMSTGPQGPTKCEGRGPRRHIPFGPRGPVQCYVGTYLEGPGVGFGFPFYNFKFPNGIWTRT